MTEQLWCSCAEEMTEQLWCSCAEEMTEQLWCSCAEEMTEQLWCSCAAEEMTEQLWCSCAAEEMTEQLCEANFPEQRVSDGSKFPLLLVPSPRGDEASKTVESLVEIIKEHNGWFKEKLLHSGAILLRGWKLEDGKDFGAVVEAIGYKDMPYEHGVAPRKHVTGPVFTATESPVEYEIGFHNEMAYLPNYPDFIMFFCETPSPEGGGGGTAIVQGEVVYKRMVKELPEFVEKLEKHGVQYSYAPVRSWEETYQTKDKAVAEERAKASHTRLEWNESGALKVHQGPYSPTLKHPVTGTTAWFNSIGLLHEKSFRLRFGDGSPVADDDAQASIRILREEQAVLQWQKGDIAVVDNLAVMHSKLPGSPPRRVLVALAT